MNNKNNKNTSELRRAIRLPHATAMVVGTIIGASIFVQPSEITGQVNSVKGVFLVWLISGLLTFFGALVCAELASIFTQSGGIYLYLKEAFSPSIGFLWGWAMFWSVHSGIIAAISVIFSRYVSYFFPMNDLMIRAVSITVIVILSAVNYLGVKQGTVLQTLFTLGKVLAIVFIIIAGFTLGSRVPEHFVTGNIAQSEISLSSFFLAMIAGLFAFGGWHMVAYNSEETINPKKTIPRALMLGTLIVTLCYIALNAVYMYILPLGRVASSTRIAADAADALIGFGGGAFMSGLVIFSTFGALSGIILCGPRVYYSMARDGLLFQWVGEIHPRFRTPHKAIIIQAVWASVLVVTGTYRALFTRVIYTEWIFFGLMAIGLFLLRRRPGILRGYRIWGYPVVPALFIVSSFAIVVNQIISDPGESLFGLSLVLIGLPVYYLWLKKIRKGTQQ
ncbi:MAG: amino acid permease [Candidatus Aminicenantes bacterium]|nr:amino acid permease [Candidatus Aminicenantes bacterium]MDH5742935.1 amino acid permease [Candidatus Aminicenantes bacterium]